MRVGVHHLARRCTGQPQKGKHGSLQTDVLNEQTGGWQDKPTNRASQHKESCVRVSERIGKSLRASALFVALTGMVTAPMVARGKNPHRQVKLRRTNRRPTLPPRSGFNEPGSRWKAENGIRQNSSSRLPMPTTRNRKTTSPLEVTPQQVMQELAKRKSAAMEAASATDNAFVPPSADGQNPSSGEGQIESARAALRMARSKPRGRTTRHRPAACPAGC